MNSFTGSSHNTEIYSLVKIHILAYCTCDRFHFKQSSTLIDFETFQKMFKNTAEQLLLLSQSRITKNSLWWCVLVSCISHVSGKVLTSVVRFYQKIFNTMFFKQIKMAISEITKKQQVIFDTVAGCRTPSYVLLLNVSRLFMCIITVFSPHFLSQLQSSFCRDAMKIFLDIR